MMSGFYNVIKRFATVLQHCLQNIFALALRFKSKMISRSLR